MIGLIAKKDFLLNLTSARFIIGFLLCLFIIPFTLMVNSSRYSEQQSLYKIEADRADKKLKNARTYSNVRPEVVREPEALSIFSDGISKNIGTSVGLQFNEYPLFLKGNIAGRANPFLNAFLSFDFITVIAIIMSLLALVFSYDCFTREREDSTLKMVLVNKISRTSFFIGKLCGILLTLVPILVFCYLLSALFIVLSPDMHFGASDWGNIALLFLSSLLYTVVFILLGMLVSSMTHKSSTSIIINLLAWIWFLFLMPNIAFYLTKSFSNIDTYENVENVMKQIDREFLNEEMDKIEVANKMFNSPMGDRKFSYNETFSFTSRKKSTADFLVFMAAWKEPRRSDYADKKWAVQKNYLDKLVKQEKARQALACLSPAEIFRQLSSSLCHTDANAYQLYMDKVRDFRQAYINYFKQNKFFETLLYFTPQPPNLFMTDEEIAEYIKNNNEYPDTPYTNEYPAINIDNFPQFTYQAQTTGNILNFALLRTAMLLAIALILLTVTMFRFRRYKVQ